MLKVNWKAIEKDWQLFTDTIINLCEKNGNKYYIKDSLKKYVTT